MARFLDLAEQTSPVDLTDRDQLLQDDAAPLIQRRDLLATREHYLVDNAQRTFERPSRILLCKIPTQLRDDHALSPESAPLEKFASIRGKNVCGQLLIFMQPYAQSRH
jgi:hypothetical protein